MIYLNEGEQRVAQIPSEISVIYRCANEFLGEVEELRGFIFSVLRKGAAKKAVVEIYGRVLSAGGSDIAVKYEASPTCVCRDGDIFRNEQGKLVKSRGWRQEDVLEKFGHNFCGS
ncbi:hypothetical protein [Mesorhizobium sp. ORS 3428]|uniref:hypothetical protein n=1 Tax=Mesorhizobium sp. ORS 3428 TaxID=540997 RepID=UPI0008DAC109|nr:hypothetical protein [Mesorhizobium sp. ORS 3428]OHV89212.1 hypothetical protein ORS3428_30970 [Mesorhizobium sp. ORS 3428]